MAAPTRGELPKPKDGPGGSTPRYRGGILRVYPHDPNAFTQGLIFEDGFLYESTGLVGRSTLRKVDLETGRVVKSHPLPGHHFGEGLARWKNRLIQLTWVSRVAFVYDLETLMPLSTFSYPTEGWGLTCDGKSLILSDGSSLLRFLDPETFEETGRVEVRDEGRPISFLNELEYLKGEVFANIWGWDSIARISPQTGKVTGWIDLGGLRSALGPVRNADVLNGIAYDSVRDRILVTGKLWPSIFEIELIGAQPGP